MRTSKRDTMLQAAKRVVQRDGVTALSYESVAAEAGVTKGGVLYHFGSREELLHALHQYVADQWESQMQHAAGAPAEQVSAAERFAAYTQASQSPERAELLLQLEAANDASANAIWEAVLYQWGPVPPPAGATAEQLQTFLAKLAADGLWLFDALTSEPLDPDVRAQVVDQITAMGTATADRAPDRAAHHTPDDDAGRSA